MKGFLIFIGIFVGSALYFFTHLEEISKDAMKQVVAEEASADPSFQQTMYSEPEKFAEKNRPYLEKRALIAKWTGILGEKVQLISIAQETRALYGESLLAKDPAYGDIILRVVKALESNNNQTDATRANEWCKEYVDLFPEGPHLQEIQNVVANMSYKFKL